MIVRGMACRLEDPASASAWLASLFSTGGTAAGTTAAATAATAAPTAAAATTAAATTAAAAAPSFATIAETAAATAGVSAIAANQMKPKAPGMPAPPNQDLAQLGAMQQADLMRRRRGVYANIFAGAQPQGGGSLGAPSSATPSGSKTQLGT